MLLLLHTGLVQKCFLLGRGGVGASLRFGLSGWVLTFEVVALFKAGQLIK